MPAEITFENEFVRIVRVRPAAASAARYSPASKTAVAIDLPTRRARFISDTARDDISNSRADEIRVELKAAPHAAAMDLDAVRIDPARYKVVLENELVRVVRLGFGPHEGGLMVTHPPRVLVTLTDVAVKLVFADGHCDERGAPAGVAAWLETETLQTENAGAVALEVILVEPKPVE
jgi:hypothetical protein